MDRVSWTKSRKSLAFVHWLPLCANLTQTPQPCPQPVCGCAPLPSWSMRPVSFGRYSRQLPIGLFVTCQFKSRPHRLSSGRWAPQNAGFLAMRTRPSMQRRSTRFKLLYVFAGPVAELSRGTFVLRSRSACIWAWTSTLSLLCGRPGLLAEIPERFSSSSLPPSFVPGRRTAVFSPRGAACTGSTPFVCLGGTP